VKNPLKRLIDLKLFKLYTWVGSAIVLMGVIEEVIHDIGFGRALLNCLWTAGYLTTVNYFLFERTLPWLRWKRFIRSFLLLLLYIFLCTEGLLIWARMGYAIYMNTDFVTTHSDPHDLSDEMGYSMTSIFLFGIVRHIYLHMKLRQTAQQLRIEKQQAELSYLKSQTNPHFLFNTLNNIYSLARDKSDLAPESILRLSKILRYMLYETGGAYIAIELELKIIGDYIALEKLRYDDSLYVNFNWDIEEMKQAIPPLLLIPLVENAFKHGVSETRNQPFVDIHLSVAKRQLAFLVKNSMEESAEPQSVKENIGLSNLRRQLELLYTDYSLSVGQTGTVFTTTLNINLASHV
jgi:two-component system LytT family sensor kinase